ncbi:MAG: HDIG domain-containing protein [Clostridia bacterium]|nr:HDIG domain-containing protein [Clostridia bacterium]
MKQPESTQKKNLSRREKLRCVLVCVAFTLLMLFVFIISIIPARYDIRLGEVPSVTIVATKDVVDEITTEQLRQIAAASVNPTYRYQEGVTEKVLSDLDQLFSQLRLIRQYGETLDKADGEGYTHEELEYARNILTSLTLRDYQIETLLNADETAFESMYDTLYTAVRSTMDNHVTEGQESEAINNISIVVGYTTDADLLQNIAMPLLQACIQPNMIIDQEATEKARQEAAATVDDIIYKQGQNIVVKGEGRITANQIRMLSTLGLLNTSDIDINFYLGAMAIVILATGLFFWSMYTLNKRTMVTFKYLLVMLCVLLLTMLLCIGAKKVLSYAMPVILASILLSALIGARAGLISNIYMAILVSALSAGGNDTYLAEMIRIFVSTVLGGTLSALIIKRSTNRLQALLAALAASIATLGITYSIGLLTSSSQTDIMSSAFLSMIGPAFSGILALAIQPLFEVMFNLPTPMRLLELSNPNQPLLKKLMVEAPGTYHHSILVANLAEAAAEAIGANALLARVAAYYHDIGKLKRPTYFSENQTNGENIHDHTEPIVSAKVLTAHPRDGAVLARQYRLPVEIQQMISEHHGNSPVMYFYHKAVQQANGEPVDINEFRYDGNRPSTKESAIIMICDTIEAAVRSRKDSMTQKELEEYILKLVRGKLSDGQLSNSPLTLRDIDAICASCAIVLKGVKHERVAYPTDQKNKRQIWSKRAQSRNSGAQPAEPAPAKEEKAQEVPVDEVKPITKPHKPTVPMTTGENLIIQPEPVAAPITVDQLLDEPETPREERPEETELPPAYLVQKDSEPELPDTPAEPAPPTQEGDEA